MKCSRVTIINRLTKARLRLADQIDILVGCRPRDGINRAVEAGDVIEEVRDTLAEIEDCIAAVWREKSK